MIGKLGWFAIYCGVFIGLSVLANFYLAGQYLLLSYVGLSVLAIIIGILFAIKNTIEEADKKASE